MNYQRLTFQFPPLTDEAAVSLHHFIEALRFAVNEQFYQQIHRYYTAQLDNMLSDSQLTNQTLDDPLF